MFSSRWSLACGIALNLIAGHALAESSAADQDTTPVSQCDILPPSVSIDTVSWRETSSICREMARVLEGIRYNDVRAFGKAVFLLHAKGYEGDYQQIARELVEIIRLRGLYDKPDRWYDTNDLLYRSWIAFNGAVGPKQVVAFLKAAGPKVAKGLSNDGLTSMIVMMKIQHQRGD